MSDPRTYEIDRLREELARIRSCLADYRDCCTMFAYGWLDDNQEQSKIAYTKYRKLEKLD